MVRNLTHEVTIYLQGGAYVFRGTHKEVVELRARYINLNVAVSGIRPTHAKQ
jgi:hypothetical protein